jgi:FAD/FMN-containing dehydrogenase
MSVSNWNGSNTCNPAAIATPRNLDELVAIVRDPSFPSPVRALGELHSLNESIETAGTAVFMTHFSKIELDRGARRVTVGAGVRMIDLKNALKSHGFQLPVVPEIGNATAGSVACCGTKDSSLGPTGRGQISSTVVAVRLVRADGRTAHLTARDDLRLIRSSYGLLGIVYEVTFEVEERVKVWYSYERIVLDRWLETGRPLPAPGSAEILGPADGFLGFLLPYRRELIVERRQLARRHRRVMILDTVRLWLRTFAWMSGARPFNAPLRLLPRPLRRLAIAGWIWVLDHGFLKIFFLRIISRFASYRADAMIDFKRPASSYFDFTFWAFPVSRWADVVPAYVKFCERFREEQGFRPALPTEVYFIRRDDAALLSFCPDEDIFTLDLVNWSDEEPAAWMAMNRAFNEFAARHGARPLLNQTKGLLPAVAKQLWTQAWHALAEERRAVDPEERFLTPFFRGVIPGGSA